MDGEGVAADCAFFVMTAQSGGRAVVLAQLVQGSVAAGAAARQLAEFGAGGEVAVQQVVLALVQAQVQALGGTRVEGGHRLVAVDGIETVRIEVAQQATIVRLFGIVGGRHGTVGADVALHEEGQARRDIVLAAIELAAPVGQRLFEAIVEALRASRRTLAAADHALGHAGDEQGAAFGHEAELALSLQRAAGDRQGHVLGVRGRDHDEAGDPVLDLDAGTAQQAVDRRAQAQLGGRAGIDDASAIAVGADPGGAAQRLAIGVEQVHRDGDLGTAVAGQHVGVGLDHDVGQCRIAA